MRIIICIIIILMYCLPAFADSGVKFLSLETGAGPIGMGGAFTAYEAEPYSAVYNPAAIYGINSVSGSFGHDTYWKKRRFESGFVSFKKGSIVYNVGLRFAEISDIEARQGATVDPDYKFDSQNMSLKFTGAFKISRAVTAGLSLGWAFEKITIYRDNAFTADLGLIVKPLSDLTLGLSVLNIGTKMNLNIEEYNIPTTLRFGAKYNYKNIKPALDIVYFDDNMYLHFGTEYKIKDLMFLRAGYR
ncbi:MAG: hypothetical protein GY865_14335, partial [candidate division Zixibacteria bacterium]|nr:hypothetical protein [candidate division Zixibacteria bacterium]